MDRHQLSGTPGGEKHPSHLIRRVTLDDVPWLAEIVYEKYGTQFAVDKIKGAEFLWRAMNSPNWVVLRGNRSFGMAVWENMAFGREGKLGVIYLLAAMPGKDWEPYYLLGFMVRWLRAQGCKSISGTSETEIDIAPLMKRLGGKEYKTYVIETERYH